MILHGLTVAGIVSDTISLPPNTSKTINAKAIIPPHIAGTFFVHVYTDATNQVYEGLLETNNTAEPVILMSFSNRRPISQFMILTLLIH